MGYNAASAAARGLWPPRRRCRRTTEQRVQNKTGVAEEPSAALRERAGAPRARPASPALAPALRPLGEGAWHSSSFDLAQGLDVKVMESKLSRETLDQLFRS